MPLSVGLQQVGRSADAMPLLREFLKTAKGMNTRIKCERSPTHQFCAIEYSQLENES